MKSKNFTRKDLTKNIHKSLGFSKNLCTKIVDNFFETLIKEIIKNNKAKISSFGTFNVVHKKKRIGRNPKTKVEAIILPRKVVKFKPSLLFKEKFNASK